MPWVDSNTIPLGGQLCYAIKIANWITPDTNQCNVTIAITLTALTLRLHNVAWRYWDSFFKLYLPSWGLYLPIKYTQQKMKSSVPSCSGQNVRACCSNIFQKRDHCARAAQRVTTFFHRLNILVFHERKKWMNAIE